MAEIKLLIDGHAFGGWQELEVCRSVEAMAGRFRLRMTEIAPNPVPRGKSVELFLEGKLIITGYIYGLNVDVVANRHTITVQGRDKTGDLVDSDALVKSQEMKNVTLRELAELLVEPFKIGTIFEVNPKEKFKKFAFQQESVQEALERACRMRGVFASGDEYGNLIFRKYGTTRTDDGIIMGQNVLSSGANYDDTDRFSLYEVFGQQPATDGVEPEAAAGPSGRAYDRAVTRYRPKIIIAEAAVDAGLAQQRAEWEAAVRAAKAVTATVTVSGWTQSTGALWRENQIVAVTLPQHAIKGDMLIKEVSYTLDDMDGTRCTMQLVRPDAYTKQPDLEAEEVGKGDAASGDLTPHYVT